MIKAKNERKIKENSETCVSRVLRDNWLQLLFLLSSIRLQQQFRTGFSMIPINMTNTFLHLLHKQRLR